jgi:hypothetical protein
MNEEELALTKSINSEDTDLIYFTLINLEKKFSTLSTSLPSSSKTENFELFYRMVYTHFEAINLLKLYYRNKCNAGDRSILHNFLLFNRNFFEAGLAAVNQSFLQNNQANKLQCLKEASLLFAQGFIFIFIYWFF